MDLLTIIGNITIVIGALVFATAALGVLRFPDAYMRVSAVGTAGGVGIVLLVAGALALQPSIPNVVKVVLIVVVHLASSAVGTMAIARATYITRTPLEHFEFDELAEATPEHDVEEEELSTERGAAERRS
ncbi:monovalent cation/H(+) antiporter subunit G [Kocuria carniphila]|uniref:cation:proton antiporter n=1 Tax=Kocuria carniphila TaxID=262208 RepID=UPI0021A2B7C9|nr:monovalent cation/H(+) antiporter subunit G [Kocuria carniphila]MCT1801610.1 monovalent cation/H(+) antiporter subunit G [Kocuria carniphila]